MGEDSTYIGFLLRAEQFIENITCTGMDVVRG